MTTIAPEAVSRRHDPSAVVARLIEYLETGKAPKGLFAPDVFTDLSLPQWRVQTDSAADVMAASESAAITPGNPRTLAGFCPPAACGR